MNTTKICALFFTSILISSCNDSGSSNNNNKDCCTIPTVNIYKTSTNYNDKVPVELNSTKTALSSYPGPTDVYTNGVLATPTELHSGYLKDNRGIWIYAAFTSYTYTQYSQLPSVPSQTDLFNSIIDNNPLTELWTCPSGSSDTDLNQWIDNNQLASSCTQIL